jgi:hypothetical protein
MSDQALRGSRVSENSSGARPSCLLYMINGQPFIRQQQHQQLGDLVSSKAPVKMAGRQQRQNHITCTPSSPERILEEHWVVGFEQGKRVLSRAFVFVLSIGSITSKI